MLFRSNILALVGGGPLPRYPPNKVMLWDDHQGRCIGELSFRSRVRRVALRRDLLAVALEHKVLVYAFSDLRLTASVETAANAAGLLALSTGPDAALLACPGLHSGQVRLEAYATRRTRFVQAHSGALGALCLTPSGKHLATASERGTLLRVWSTADGTRLQELRRGTDAARIHSLAFSGGRGALAATPPEWLAVTSDRGTAHVFSLRRGQGVGPAGDRADGGGGAQQQQQPEGRANPTSKLAFVSVSRGLGEVTQSLGLGSWWDLRTQMPWAAFLWLLMPAQGSTMYVLPSASPPTGCNPHPCPPLPPPSVVPAPRRGLLLLGALLCPVPPPRRRADRSGVWAGAGDPAPALLLGPLLQPGVQPPSGGGLRAGVLRAVHGGGPTPGWGLLTLGTVI